MQQVYDWDTNKISFISSGDLKFDLELRGEKNIVSGTSASGKTLLCNIIAGIKGDLNSVKQYEATNIYLANQNSLEGIRAQENKLIIMDRADLLLDAGMVDFINHDYKNRYLLFLRKPMGLEITPNHFAEMVFSDDTFKLRYLFSVGGWC